MLLAASGSLKALGIKGDMVREGPLHPALEAQAETLGLRDSVDFTNGVNFESIRVLSKRKIAEAPEVRERASGDLHQK